MVLTQRLDPAGFIPTFILDAKIPESLGAVEELRHTFSRDDEIDLKERTALISVMENQRGDQGYKPAELDIINNSKQKLRDSVALLKVIDSPDSLVKMKSGFIPGESHIVGLAETEIDASIEE